MNFDTFSTAATRAKLRAVLQNPRARDVLVANRPYIVLPNEHADAVILELAQHDAVLVIDGVYRDQHSGKIIGLGRSSDMSLEARQSYVHMTYDPNAHVMHEATYTPKTRFPFQKRMHAVTQHAKIATGPWGGEERPEPVSGVAECYAGHLRRCLEANVEEVERHYGGHSDLRRFMLNGLDKESPFSAMTYRRLNDLLR